MQSKSGSNDKPRLPRFISRLTNAISMTQIATKIMARLIFLHKVAIIRFRIDENFSKMPYTL